MNDSSDKDDAVQELKQLFSMILGPDAADVLFEGFEENAMDYVVAPQSYLKDVEERMSSKVDIDKVVDHMRSNFPKILTELAKTTASVDNADLQRIRSREGTLELAKMVFEVAKTDWHGLVGPINRVQGLDLSMFFFGARGMGRFARGFEDAKEEPTFEETTAMLAHAVNHAAEAFYRPMLQSILEVTCINLGRDAPSGAEVGATIARCRDMWTAHKPGLLPLINDDVRIIRNSEAHDHTDIDVRREIVAFTNVKRSGERETREFMLSDLGVFAGDFSELCIAVWSTFTYAGRRLRIASV